MARDAAARALARAIAEGTPVSWAEAESQADDESARATIRQLRVIADIADLHQRLPLVLEPSSGARPEADSSPEHRPAAGAAAQRPDTGTEPPGQWGSLTLLERVGQGAFGEVYRAWDPLLDREVALKLLRQPESARETATSVAVEEGRLLARVRHPNVVTVYGADRVGGWVGLWTEFLHGRTLEQIAREHGPLGVQETVSIGLDLCRALSAVHRAGLLHRDVKAHNVMREEGGRIVLMDFGTGVDLSESDDDSRRGAGTPLYMAPEVFEGRSITPRADLYSLGVLLYHLVSGSYPVSGRTVGEVRVAHRFRRQTRLRDACPDLPDAFVRVIERALSPDPAERHESADDMELALAASLPKIGVDGSVVPASAATPQSIALTTSPSTMKAAARRPRIGRWVAIALPVAALVLASTAVGIRLVQGRWPGLAGSASRSGGARQDPHAGVVFRQVTIDANRIDTSGGAPSPDGRFISGVDWSTGDLAVLEFESGVTRRLTSNVKGSDEYNANSSSPAPDGNRIAYAWTKEGAFTDVRITDLQGSTPRILYRDPVADFIQLGNWSADGRQILAIVTRKDRVAQLALISSADGSVRVLESFVGQAPGWAGLSPDGRFVAYDLRVGSHADNRDIFVRPVDADRARVLVQHPANDRFPLWTPDGGGMLFVSDRAGTMGLWTIPVHEGVATGPADVVQKDLGQMYPLGLTTAGTFYYALQTGMVDVCTATLDIAGGAIVLRSAPVRERLLGSTMSADWSPDGRYLAFASEESGSPRTIGSRTIVVQDVVSGETRELKPDMGFFVAPRWSPDGRSIIVKGSNAKAEWGAYEVDVVTGAVLGTALTGTFGSYEWLGTSDALVYVQGRSVVVVDRRAGTTRRIHTVDSPVRITDLAIAPGGSRLAVSTFNGDDMWTVVSMSSDRAVPREILRVTKPEFLDVQAWVDDEVLFTKGQLPADLTRDRELWAVPADGGEPRPLGLTMKGLRELRVHPDRRRVAFTTGAPSWEIRAMERFLSAALR